MRPNARIEHARCGASETSDCGLTGTGRVFVPPFDDEHVLAGFGTSAIELLQQSSGGSAGGLDRVYVSAMGGGGLVAGPPSHTLSRSDDDET